MPREVVDDASYGGRGDGEIGPQISRHGDSGHGGNVEDESEDVVGRDIVATLLGVLPRVCFKWFGATSRATASNWRRSCGS